MKRVAIVGIYPPPLGGISVHTKRLKEILDKNNINCTIFNEGQYEDIKNNIIRLKSYKNFIFNSYKLNVDVIHFHCTTADVRALLWICKKINKKKKIILTIHGVSLKDQIEQSNFILKKSLIKSLKEIDKIIVVNKEYKEYLPKFGIESNKIHYIPPFIKPLRNNKDLEKIDNSIIDFLNYDGMKILTNGSIKFYHDEELYGFDLLIKSIKDLKKDNINVRLLISVLSYENQNKEERQYYLKLKESLKDLNLEKEIMFSEVKDTEYYPILELGDIFVRATNTDGDPISLKEALSFNVPSIASDIIERPEQCIIFKNRNVEDLTKKIKYTIVNYLRIKETINKNKVKDATEDLLDFYKYL